MLVLINGENEVTLPPPLTRVVPVEVVYQSIVQLADAVALKVTVPEPQRELALALVGTAGTGATYAVTVEERVLEPQELLAIAVTDLVPVEAPLTV